MPAYLVSTVHTEMLLLSLNIILRVYWAGMLSWTLNSHPLTVRVEVIMDMRDDRSLPHERGWIENVRARLSRNCVSVEWCIHIPQRANGDGKRER